MDYQAELKALTDAGVTVEDAEAALEKRKPGSVPAFDLWPENVEAFEIFSSLQTQWHRTSGFGPAARTGLIYSEARLELKERGLPRARRNELMGDLRVMERAALDTWNGDSGSDG